MDGSVDLDAAIVIIVPFFRQAHKLLTGGIGVEAEILVGAKIHRPAREIGLQAAACYDLTDLIAEAVHIRHARRAEAHGLGHGQRRRSSDRARVHLLFAREHAVFEPVMQRHVVGVAAQQIHRQMRVAVDKTRHEHHTGAVDDLRGLFLGRLFRHIGDLAVRHADERVLPERHLFVHGDDVDMGKQGIHGSLLIASGRGSRAAARRSRPSARGSYRCGRYNPAGSWGYDSGRAFRRAD